MGHQRRGHIGRVVNSSGTDSSAPAPDVRQLRHPLERRVAALVTLVDLMLMAMLLGILFLGAEWLETFPALQDYKGHVKILLALVMGAPIVATFLRRRRRFLAQEDSIRIGERILPEVHAMLARHCQRVGIPLPELYLSESVDETTSFSWRNHQCI